MLQVPTTLDETTPAVLRPVLQPLPAMTKAGTRLLEAASDLFYDRGVRAVGVDLIAESAGTTKKTLYDSFGSKDALVALYLLRRAHRWREHLLARLAEACHDLDACGSRRCCWSSRRWRRGWEPSAAAVPSSTPTPNSARATTPPCPHPGGKGVDAYPLRHPHRRHRLEGLPAPALRGNPGRPHRRRRSAGSSRCTSGGPGRNGRRHSQTQCVRLLSARVLRCRRRGGPRPAGRRGSARRRPARPGVPPGRPHLTQLYSSTQRAPSSVIVQCCRSTPPPAPKHRSKYARAGRCRGAGALRWARGHTPAR